MSQLGVSPSRMVSAYYYSKFNFSFAGAVTLVQMLPNDPNRVMIFISPQPTGMVQSIYPISTANSNSPWTIGSTTPGYVLTYHDYGPIIGETWFAFATTFPGSINGWSMGYDPGRAAVDPLQPRTPDPHPILSSENRPVQPVNAPVFFDPILAREQAAQTAARQAALRKSLPSLWVP